MKETDIFSGQHLDDVVSLSTIWDSSLYFQGQSLSVVYPVASVPNLGRIEKFY